MLLTFGGLMAAIVLPGHTVPALAVTASVSLASAVHRRFKKRVSGTATSPNNSLPNGDAATQENITLQWADLSCHLHSKKNGVRTLLANASGVARPGRVLAILGPSGAGKTTLLNALAGRVASSPNVELRGSVLLNGMSINETTTPIAYVTQDDLFFSQLSVRETLNMAATMRLPSSMSRAERCAAVDALVRKMGLMSATETRVGDEKNRGISGGERKRLSLASELISAPRLIMCDEPTSGLDAFQAEKVMNSLQALAEAGHTVVCSIHQPSSSIFKMFDDVILLADGRVVYAGSVAFAPTHFASAGYPMPDQCNPAERYLDLISVDTASEETQHDSNKRIDELVKAFESMTDGVGNTDDALVTQPGAVVPAKAADAKRLRPMRVLGALFVRAWRQVIRDKKTNISRFMSSFMSALLFGSIYWKIKKTQATIQDRLGLLQVCVINSAMSALVKTLNVFPKESVLVNRERVRGSYSVLQYFGSKLLAEMPVSAFFPLMFSLTVYPMVQLSGGIGRIARFMGIITLESFTAASYGLMIGALLPSTESALAVGPASFVLQIVFGGLYITEKNVPKWASWIPRISLVKHAYEGLVVNEFRGLKFETTNPWDMKNGEQVLQRLTWGDSTVAKTCISQVRVLSFNYLVTFILLALKKPQFAQVQPVEIVEIKEDQPHRTEEHRTEPTVVLEGSRG